MSAPDVYQLRLKFKQKDGSLRVEYEIAIVNKQNTLRSEIESAKRKYKDSAEGDIEVVAKLRAGDYYYD